MKFFLIIALLLTSFPIFANNSFIPNHYKNRRAPNTFSAIGWSKRKEMGLEIGQGTTKRDIAGSSYSETNETSITPWLYYRFENNINLEFLPTFSTEKTRTFSPASEDKVTDNFNYVGAGYEFSEIPLALGIAIGRSDKTRKVSSTNTEIKSGLVYAAPGIGYQLDNGLFLGAGVFSVHFDNDPDSFHILRLGIGKVYGDKSSPTATTEMVLSYNDSFGTRRTRLNLQSLMNCKDFQYYGDLGLSTTDGNIQGNTINLELGLDYQFYHNYYLGPEVRFEKEDSHNSNDENDLSASLQAGYRNTNFETYLRFNLQDEKEDALNFLQEERTKTQIVSLAAVYKF